MISRLQYYIKPFIPRHDQVQGSIFSRPMHGNIMSMSKLMVVILNKYQGALYLLSDSFYYGFNKVKSELKEEEQGHKDDTTNAENTIWICIHTKNDRLRQGQNHSVSLCYKMTFLMSFTLYDGLQFVLLTTQ